MEAAVETMAGVAREYCQLIDAVADGRAEGDWLGRLVSLLPRLHAAVTSLDVEREVLGAPATRDYDARFELYACLHRTLGRLDGYWLEFDALHGATMSGSLADDLADIYFDLKRGLQLLRAYPERPARAAGDWRASFRLHWGRHLVDAERHIHELDSQNRIGQPCL